MSSGPEIDPLGGSWITHGLVADGAARLVLAEAAEVADALRQAHGLDRTATELAAQATIAAFLLSAHVKGEERLTLQLVLQPGGVRFVGEVDPSHRFRGRLSPSDLAGRVDLERLEGLLFAAKHDGEREVYRGATPVEGVSITQALRHYLRDSAQVQGVILTAVSLDDDGRVVLASGAVVERLPVQADAPSLEPAAFAERFGALERCDTAAILRELGAGQLGGERVRVLHHRPIFWGCSCSRERVLDTLAGLGRDELLSMADDDDGASVDCHFCNAHYDVTADELRGLARPQEPAR